MDFQNLLFIFIENLYLLLSVFYPGLIPQGFEGELEKLSKGGEVKGESVETVQFKVARVVDGDTIVLDNGKTLRYIGIDAPEISRGKECFAEESKNYNKFLLEGKNVQLEKDVSETDRYGRLLRYVYVDGVMVNSKLVLEGYAFASSYPPDIKYQALLKAGEEDARKNNRGIWMGCTNSQF